MQGDEASSRQKEKPKKEKTTNQTKAHKKQA